MDRQIHKHTLAKTQQQLHIPGKSSYLSVQGPHPTIQPIAEGHQNCQIKINEIKYSFSLMPSFLQTTLACTGTSPLCQWHVLAIHGTPLSSNENKQPHVTLLSQWTSPLCQLPSVFAIPGTPLGSNENSQTHVTLLGQWTSSFPKLKPLQNGDNSHHNRQNAQHRSLRKPHQTK